MKHDIKVVLNTHEIEMCQVNSVHYHMASGEPPGQERAAYMCTMRRRKMDGIFIRGGLYTLCGWLLWAVRGGGCVDRGKYWAEMRCHTTPAGSLGKTSVLLWSDYAARVPD